MKTTLIILTLFIMGISTVWTTVMSQNTILAKIQKNHLETVKIIEKNRLETVKTLMAIEESHLEVKELLHADFRDSLKRTIRSRK